MHVRNFYADTLDEALKEIKRELGPDAIILKTKTNKGLIGQIKKKKIEITAAISEKNYGKKRIVDTILDKDQKENLYKGPSENIANTLDGYGNMAINRPVKVTNKKSSSEIDLDQFLSGGGEKAPVQVQGPNTEINDALEAKLLQLEKKIEGLEDKIPDEFFKFRNKVSE